MKLINPVTHFGTKLCQVQNPSSYTGGEYGQIVKAHSENDKLFNFGMAFPDLYSIGMSNQAIKIIYHGLNKQEDVRCERIFAVDTDFEKLLKETDTPLYTLETGMPLHNLDMIGFSIGYELGITGVLSILELGKIPLLAKDRTEDDPIIFCGGVGATNPEAFSCFFDATFIGEAEGGMFELVEKLAQMKQKGAKRSELLKEFARHPSVWTKNMSVETCGHDIARRAIFNEFGQTEGIKSYLPLPNIKPVQDHGVVEIMRGCPNGCRFCHAGVYYRPQRVKTKKQIFDDVDALVYDGGYRQISLTSLSSADYPKIDELISELNERYAKDNVSFQLPSLKVNSFTLPLLEQLSEVRKSGLTFAVETPDEAWQLRLNKEVYAQHLVDLILEAKKHGWNKAKFYFMVGLPFPETDGKTEEKAIVDFMLDLQSKTHIQCNINVGTFIPKPHTAYQWIRQISMEESQKKMQYIRENLPRQFFKVGTHDIFTSYLEGLASRGDERAGLVIYNAYMKGARLAAWEEHLREDRSKWEEAFAQAGYDVNNEILRERSKDEKLPWHNVSLGPGEVFFKREWERNCQEVLTNVCSPDCDHKCGVCNNKGTCVNLDNTKDSDKISKIEEKQTTVRQAENITVMYRALFAYEKTNGSQFYAHISHIEMFNRAILKSKLPFIYTNGFNPVPRLEFATTLSLGLESFEEIGSALLYDDIDEKTFIETINKSLPSNLQIKKAFIFPITNQRRRESISASLWGSEYEYEFYDGEDKLTAFLNSEICEPFIHDELIKCEQNGNLLKVILPFKKDRPFRNAIEEFYGDKTFNICAIRKIHCFAKPEISGWTPEMNQAYQDGINGVEKHSDMMKLNDEFKNKKVSAKEVLETQYDSYESYFDLYRKIAVINKGLIDQRHEMFGI